jgi:hypothetical protein
MPAMNKASESAGRETSSSTSPSHEKASAPSTTRTMRVNGRGDALTKNAARAGISNGLVTVATGSAAARKLRTWTTDTAT